MTNIPSFGRSTRMLASFLCICTLFLGMAQGQTSQGTLTGRVSDSLTGRGLAGALVTVVGSGKSAYTDETGAFTILQVPQGSQTVSVYYVGYERSDQAVTISGRAMVNIALDSTIEELEGFVVREQLAGQALAINKQKAASGIVNIVSEEIFGVMREGNIGQALQRLPGISVDESQDGTPQNINIRGIPGEFNSFQIDGQRVPTSGGSRSFNTRQFAADGVTNIEVIKAVTPDRDGDAIGGIINVISRDAFQVGGREIEINAGGTYNEDPGEWGYNGSIRYTDLFSVNGGDRNLGISATLSIYEADRYSTNADQDWVQVTPELHPELNLTQYDFPVWFMESTHWEYTPMETTTYTFQGSVDYRFDNGNTIYFKPVFSHYDRFGTAFETDINIDTEFDDEPGGNTYDLLTPTMGRGTVDSGARIGWIGTDEDRENDFYSFAFGGESQFDAGKLTYDFYYSRNKNVRNKDNELNMEAEPDGLVWEYEIFNPFGAITIDQVDTVVDITDLTIIEEGELEIITAEHIEEIFNAQADYEHTWDLTNSRFALKTGAKWRQSKPRFDRTVDLWETDETFPYDQVTIPTNDVLFLKPKLYDVIPALGEGLLATNPGLFEFVEDDSLEDSNVSDFDATEDTYAAYLMGTWTFGIHQLIGGVRYEKVEWSNTNKIVSYLNDVPTVTPIETGDDYDFFLPGIHYRAAFTENLIFRASYNMSYGRPRLSELTRGRWVDDDGNIEDGNPNLKPAESQNFDVQLEYYTDTGGLYSVGFFYKDVQDFTYTQVYDFNDLGPDGIPIPEDGGDLEYERPVNGSEAQNYGIELIARQNLVFLPGPFDGFSVALSATFTESDATYPNRTDNRDLPLEGFSDTLTTASLDYAKGGFFARLDYRYRSDYIEGLGSDIESDEFYAAEERVDAEVSYRFSENFTIYANGTNLTDRPQVSYQGYPPFVEDASFSGRKYSFGAKYRF